MKRGLRGAAVLALLAGCHALVSCGSAGYDKARDEWPQYGRTADEQRYSPLDEVNSETVSRLGVSWFAEFDTDRGQEATPIMVDGVLYVSSAWSKVFAFDAGTGRKLWSFDPKVPPQTLFTGCCDAVNRGVAVADGRVFVASLDGRLIALDAKDGRQIWSTDTVDRSKPYTSSGAPRVVGNLVLIGNSGAEYGVRGYISAYDTATGRMAWRFYTVPNPEGKPDNQPSDLPLLEKAAGTWFGDGWKKMGGGGGTVWDAISYDPDAGLVYFGVGNGGPFDIGARSDGRGDNLFLSSIVAVRAQTGEYVWHYQTTPGDSWDYTATQQIVLADLPIGGKTRKVLMQAPKNGIFYVLDRLTGELLSASPYVPINWANGVDLRTGRPNFVENAQYQNGPKSIKPGALGAHSWHPMAFSPKTGLVYIPAQHLEGVYARDAKFAFRQGHSNTGLDVTSVEFPDDPDVLKAVQAVTYGELIAWDPLSGKRRWSVKRPYFLNGGVVATAGDLVFQGTAEGKFLAYDARNGKELWSYSTVNGIVAGPITYAIKGKQYVAVMVGYGGFGAMVGMVVPDRPRLPGRLLVFALDGKAKVPAQVVPPATTIDVQSLSSAGDVKAGAAGYADNCLVCHGLNANSRFTADLRRSTILQSQNAWQSVVIDGAFSDKGMVGFAKYLTPKDAEDIRAYVISKARIAAAAEASRP